MGVEEVSDTESLIVDISQWIAMVISFVSLFWYGDQYRKKQCGWEIIYVAGIESILYVLLLGWGDLSPFLWKLDKQCHGKEDVDCWGTDKSDIMHVPVARYFGWLLTCPVIIIALSNLTGLKDDYNWRTMKVLSADQGLIMMGATTALTGSESSVKYVLFAIALCFGSLTFYTALEIYVESHANVPPVAKKTVTILAYMYFFSWGSYPVYFLLGPEGFGHINPAWSDVCHAVTDLFSKNLWGIYSWYLRVQVREYHRKKWFEEQERLKQGEKEFEVAKERRPEMTTDAVAAIFTSAAQDEEDVDPAYAEYRRQRRRNRGRSLSEPDPQGMIGGLLGLVDNRNSAEKEAAEMKALKQQQKMQMAAGGMTSVNPLGGGMGMNMGMNMGMGNPMGAGMDTSNPIFQQMTVAVADHMGFQQGQFFVAKMEQEMGAVVQACRSKQELLQTLQFAQQSGRPTDMVLAIDGLLTPSDAISLHQQFKTVVVQFGTAMAPQQSFGEGYLQTPGPGQMFNSGDLYLIANKVRTRNLASQQTVPGLAGAGASMPMQPPPAGTNASVDVLLAEMNALKAYLNNGN
uniref:Uncharacterized protein n=1 Tax=Pyramimonas obovata TaxID=1411642 RepID=A0A7S0QVT0_9CHLO|mmetsp:Transcript_14052/g.30045  ORF Transcript_14052/g.30045 Transcript_14052/m.30045 type:complete len:573 (+) Transcript_14052:121-1839(+)|eukprot:CAMPEP_0118923854 /NCGR_PEP_ID=MMETSP1169-20130426/2235_1 /TAXON_ID=36882 /ORGANISM="Pyramimonas obovata, Strain CCMP722" /LENGTH=572 /DNA_ID=CAMNT_0006864909 /DNA_START=99 /DNA_END=1817 /DNA_ORIENTATION=-